MTACTNKGGKAGRVITAALVATLSVGAPVVALATTADSGDAQLMAQSSKQAFADGVVTAQDGKGGDVTFPDKGVLTFTGEGQYLLPTSIKVSGVDYELNLKSGTGNAKVEYFDSSDQLVCSVGKGITQNLAKNYDWATGTYTAKITYLDEDSQYNNCTKTVQFKVVDASLEDATIFNATDDNTDTSVTGFTYNGGVQEIGLAVDGAVVDDTEYSLEVYKGGSVVASDAIKDAGDYTVYVIDQDTGKQVKTLNFTVAKLDLSSATVSVGDVLYQQTGAMATPNKVTANGHDISAETTGDVDITFAFTNGDTTQNSKPGSYQATVTPKSGNANVSGKAVVNFNVVEALALDGDFKYNGTVFSTDLEIDLSEGQSFSASKIKVDNAGVDEDWVDVTYADASGAAVSAADLKAPGTYYVTARVNAELSDYTYGSNAVVLKVVVTAGQIEANKIVFKYNGEVTDALEVEYNGSDFAKAITSEVTVGDKKLEAGTDYELVILDESGKKVDSIVDAGDYKVEIKSDSYKLPNKGYSMTVKVSPIAITGIYADSALIRDFGGRELIPYTGEDIDAGFTFGYYTDADGDECLPTAEGATWNALPEGSVAIDGIKYQKDAKSTWSVVDGLKEKGFYQLYITLDPETAVNYKYNDGADGQAVTNVIEVSDDKVFVDVPSDAWYAESVYTANQENYVFGVNNSNVFAPEASINRADVVCVLYRMAGGTVDTSEDWVGGDNVNSYLSKFSDVDGKAYYAKALVWATKTGVVTGYDDGTFGPGNAVTAEEFATMLARYAKLTGTDTTVDDVDAVLGGVADGAQVSDFAREAVAWAVESGYMAQGSDIVPQSQVSRARMVTIAVRYQPEQLDIIGDNNPNW